MEINERDFFKNPFSRDDIKDLLNRKPASEMFNFKSPAFKRFNLEGDRLDDSELVDLMLKEPRLICRPIVRISDEIYYGAGESILERLIG